MMTIFDRALELIRDDSKIGLGSGRTAQAFVRVLGEQVRAGELRVTGVATSHETAGLARQAGIPLMTLAEVGTLDVAIDGADEVDPQLDLIKGYGRAFVREKVVAASSRRLIILAGTEKLVPQLGSRGKLPIEVLPFALSLCESRLSELGCRPTLWSHGDRVLSSENGNYILDCAVAPIANPAALENALRAIPGVVGTGLFLGMADIVLVGDSPHFQLAEEKTRRG